MFTGDSTRIGRIQHSVYYEAVGVMFKAAHAAYLHAQRVIGITTELGDMISTENFDHRSLQSFHDSIAGQFRFDFCCKADLFEEVLDADNTEHDIIFRWMRFLRKELDRLFDKYVELPRLILTAVIYANPDSRGTDAEDVLYKLTRQEYDNLYPNNESNT